MYTTHTLSLQNSSVAPIHNWIVVARETLPAPADAQRRQQHTAHNTACPLAVAATSAAGSTADFKRTQLAAAAGMQQHTDHAMHSSMLCQIAQPDKRTAPLVIRPAAFTREMLICLPAQLSTYLSASLQ
jgi:hypothetical protein